MTLAIWVSSVCKPRICSRFDRRSAVQAVASVHTQGADAQPAHSAQGASRRGVLLASLLGAASFVTAPAQAGLVEDVMKQNMRGELDPIDAIVQLMDARGVLYELRDLAATPRDSAERKASNSLLPGYASRLRKLANAAPTVAGLAAGTDKEAQVSAAYGGDAAGGSLTDPIFITVGQVLNYSGRGLSDGALTNPGFAAAAISAIEDLLIRVPENAMATARARREVARAAKLQL